MSNHHLNVSIITVCKNSAATIVETMASVASQDYPWIQHVIVDGKSTDDTLQLIQANAGPRVSVMCKEDKGIYEAMNNGLALARGGVIAFLNADDCYINDQVISKVMSAFLNPEVDAVYGDIVYVKRENTDAVHRYWRAGNFSLAKFRLGWMPPHPTFFVRAEIFEKYGRFIDKYKLSGDYELMLRFLYKHQIKVVYRPLLMVRMRSGGVGNASLRSRWLANREDADAWTLNKLPTNWVTTFLKPVSKLPQLLAGYRWRSLLHLTPVQH